MHKIPQSGSTIGCLPDYFFCDILDEDITPYAYRGTKNIRHQSFSEQNEEALSNNALMIYNYKAADRRSSSHLSCNLFSSC